MRPERDPTMDPLQDYVRYESRRQFLGRGANAVGWAALAALWGRGSEAGRPCSRAGPVNHNR